MQDVMSLEGKTIVVTRAAQGIGQAISSSGDIDLGPRVIGVDLNGDKLDAFAAKTNGKPPPDVGNVADPEFTENNGARRRRCAFGAIYGLVNNAGITRPAMIQKMTLQQWSEVIRPISTRNIPVDPGRGSDHWLLRASPARRRPGIHRGSLVACRKSRFHRPAQTMPHKERPARHDGCRLPRNGRNSPFERNPVCFGVVETPMTETIRGDKFVMGILGVYSNGTSGCAGGSS